MINITTSNLLLLTTYERYSQVEFVFLKILDKGLLALLFMKKKLSLILFLSTLFIYALTLSPTINSFDSAEFITGAYFLGIVHSPGYPLFLLIGHLATLVPIGQIPVRMNFLSAVFGALSVLMSFNINYRLSQSYKWSIGAALFLAFSNLFWGLSTITTVYTLSSLFICLMFWQYMQFDENPSFFNLIFLSFLFGLSLTHHISAILLIPWLGISILRKLRSFKSSQICVALLVFILPFSLYFYFPLRHASNPPIDYIRDYFNSVNLSSVSGIVWMASGQMFSSEMFGRSLGAGLGQTVEIIYSLWLNYLGLGLLLSLFGLWQTLKMKNFWLSLSLLGAELSFLIFYSYYNVVNNLQMIAPLLIILSFTISLGGKKLSSVIKERMSFSNWREVLSITTIIFALLISNWASVDRSKDWSAYTYAGQVLKIVEPNALILT